MLFKNSIEEFYSLPVSTRNVLMHHWNPDAIYANVNLDAEGMISLFVSSWLKCGTDKTRKIYRVNGEAKPFFDLMRQLYEPRKESIIRGDSVEIQLPEGVNALTPIIISFKEPQPIEVAEPLSRGMIRTFNELWIYRERCVMVAPDGAFEAASTGMVVPLYVHLFENEVSSFVIQLKDHTDIYDMTHHKSIKSTKHVKWRYDNITVVAKRIVKNPGSRPIDFTTREEVILERKPHFRTLRNGEVRWFSGVKAKYYKRKDVEVVGTILTV